ncbi:DNA replication/repair protein RecF [Patescibacteria group bacterium]
MFLTSLSLQNFRIFDKKDIDFSSNTNLIIGANAAGKTNILEAIYLLATGKSFRARKEIEMIRSHQELAVIQAVLNDNNDKTDLEIMLTTGEVQGRKTGRKLYKINNVSKRWKDFAGNLLCVMFRPEDINIILGSPSIRRFYLDLVLEQVDWQYRASSLSYQKGIRQRNKLLDKINKGEAQTSQLRFWNQLVIKNGGIITQKRQELIDFFNQYLSSCDRLKRETRRIEMEYDKSVINTERLEKYSHAELAIGSTLVGPHRDDIKFMVRPCDEKQENVNFKNNRDLLLYGSRGEQRMAIFNLKLAEAEFITKTTNKRPVLLLDDIFSELDKIHRNQIMEIISLQQTIITTTDINLINKKIHDKIKILKLI